MKMMRLLSSRARQNITYLCQNSIAWSSSKDVLSDKTIKVLTDDEIELHGHSKDIDVSLNTISDECKVSLICDCSYMTHQSNSCFLPIQDNFLRPYIVDSFEQDYSLSAKDNSLLSGILLQQRAALVQALSARFKYIEL